MSHPHVPLNQSSLSADLRADEKQTNFLAISAEDYEKFRRKIVKEEQPDSTSRGIPLKPSDSQCRAIEVMCAGIGVVLLEVFAGRRPASHVSKWLSKECQQRVVLRSKVTANSLRRKYARVPLNHSPFAPQITMPKTRRAKAQKISPTVFEVSLIMQDYARVRAMALRVEKVFSRWQITEIEIA